MNTINVGGRPSKFTAEIRKAIIADIADAIPYEYAAEANGVSQRILYVWLDQGRKDQDEGIESDFSVFLQDIKRAERERIRKHKENIDNGSDTWTCDAWMLERRWWKHYSKSAPILDFEQRLKKMEEGTSNGKVDSSETKENS